MKVTGVNWVEPTELPQLLDEQIVTGPLNNLRRKQLANFLVQYREGFAQNLSAIVETKSVELKIRLSQDQLFTYSSYRLTEALNSRNGKET